MDPVISIKSYIYDRLVVGTLSQVSSETFKGKYELEYFPFSRVNYTGEIKNTVEGNGNYLMFLQKGIPVPTTGYMIEYDLRLYYGIEARKLIILIRPLLI